MPPGENSWEEYREFVLAELKRHSTLLRQMNTMMVELKVDISRLQTKAAVVWGALGGVVCAIILKGLELIL